MPFLLEGQWRSALIMLIFGLRMTIPPAAIVALPLYWWLSRSGRLSIYWAAFAGGAAGAAFGLLAAVRRLWLFGHGKTFGEIWRETFIREEPHIFILIGICCGLFGWLIAFGLRTTPPQPSQSEA